MATEVLPGLLRIPIRLGPIAYTTTYLISGDELVLVDTGLPKKHRTILRAVEQVKRRPFDVRHIVITHHHADHAGGLAALAEATEARIYVHPLDAPIVRGDQSLAGPTKMTTGGRIIGWIARRLYPERLAHVSIGHELGDGEELKIADGLRVVHTPGHTAGHVSLLWPRHGGVLFAGDAAGNLGRLGPPIGTYTEDMDEAKRSIAKLAELDFEVAVFGHGAPIRGRALTKFRKLVERLAR